MLLRIGFVLATTLLVCLLSTPPIAEPLDRAAVVNPFVAPAPPLERRFDEWREALRLSGEQDRLFRSMELHLQRVADERDAAIVAAAIDRNREPRSARDPGAALRARAERLSRHAESLRALADAESSFFASLSDEQRRIADDMIPRDTLNLRDVFRRRGLRPDKNG
ncbi:Spy/CpxP family protein refolding chaperone [Methylosinus trichosporium]|uniref:Amino acid ABC transporter substrate-binding protein n=1 Tax=Methylosinus trichosporium (strain ATCC 35070 / NCIMB 11131 / UNIQEM 75 / OB3b) TaxID=595536 RepID=A0A2D2D088_METT3|nr:Spy/CpxP family protein refolding chaperone [Methylosinus trichosporium]ATQ68364.1 amino acid ABC transporter substrate-binding protein [Methylosinus trichosporium OB3b]